MIKKQIFKQLLYVLLTLFLLVITLIGGRGISLAFADTSDDTSVLTDLQIDTEFDITAYPDNSRDNSIHVIQIAESTQGELLIYTYQPCQQTLYFVASSVNIAKQENNSAGISFPNYKLTLISCSGVFCKYKVEGFELNKTAVRYYNISNILRPFNKLIDAAPGGGNTVSEVPNKVGQCWTACTVAGEVTYTMTESEVIEIKEKYVGYINYDDGANFSWMTTSAATSAHFVAFSTDKPIDKLLSADVSFNEREVTYQICANIAHLGQGGHSYKNKFNYQYGNEEKHEPDPVTIKYSEKGSNTGGNGTRPANKYTWDRIRTTEQFLADAEDHDIKITSGDENSLDGTKWVLNFYETPMQAKTTGKEWAMLANGFAALFNGVGEYDCRYTEVSDVMILRLEFETDGQHYNLGVVDNKQTGSQTPWGGNTPGIVGGIGSGCTAAFPNLPWWVYVIFAVSAILVLVFMGWLGMRIVSIIFGDGGGSGSEVRKIKREMKSQMRLLKYKANLEREEKNRQRALEVKDELKAQKAKDKQEAKRRKKTAKNKRKAVNSKNKK